MEKQRDLMNNIFCSCCGLKKIDIQKELDKIEFQNRIRSWNGHKQYEGTDYFYDSNRLVYCENCGKLLKNEDIKTTSEFMGMFGMSRAYQTLVLGYTCRHCGYEEEY